MTVMVVSSANGQDAVAGVGVADAEVVHAAGVLRASPAARAVAWPK
jgi:hypothetical protein